MTTLTLMIVLAILATVGVLLVGVVSMARGGDFDARHSTQIMFSRVGLQAVTFILLLIALYLNAA